MVNRPLRIASRGSDLALWQSHAVERALRALNPRLDVEIRIIHTTGDRILDVPLAQIGDRGLFTKEVDAALLNGEADLAVHSLKDVPTRLPEGLTIGAVTERADPRDVLLCAPGTPSSLAELPPGAVVGTSSLRRRSQLRALRPDLDVRDLRGNLNTRLRKLDAGEYHAIVLAAAGVLRLGWKGRISEFLDPPQWLPAVGQGALAVVAREDQPELHGWLAHLQHPETAACVTAERVFLRRLEGGCQVPIGALARIVEERLEMHGLIADLDGETVLRAHASGSLRAPDALGERLAQQLVELGAGEILEGIRRETPELVRAPAAP